MIPMRHPEIEEYPTGYPVAVSEAQAKLRERRGWVRVTGSAVDYSRMTKGPLQDEVERLGLQLPEGEKPTVASLRTLLEQDQERRLALLAETPVVTTDDEED